MRNIWFISDQHYLHKNILKFEDENGLRIRPEFQCKSPDHPNKCNCVNHMDEYMIEKHNSVVKDGDKVYFGGDVTFRYGSEFNNIMSRLKGQKR